MTVKQIDHSDQYLLCLDRSGQLHNWMANFICREAPIVVAGNQVDDV